MKYVSAKWTAPESQPRIIAAIGDDGARYFIPGDNCDIAPRQQFLSDGGAIEPAGIPEPVIPDRVSSRQFFMILDKMDATTNPGIYDQVNDWVASQPRAIRLVYEKAGSFVRTDEMLQQGFVALGLTPEQVDAFSTAAATL